MVWSQWCIFPASLQALQEIWLCCRRVGMRLRRGAVWICFRIRGMLRRWYCCREMICRRLWCSLKKRGIIHHNKRLLIKRLRNMWRISMVWMCILLILHRWSGCVVWTWVRIIISPRKRIQRWSSVHRRRWSILRMRWGILE